MRTYWLGTARGFLLPAVLLLLAACGGGGGGGGGGPAPVAYGGNTAAAIVTPTNASQLTANVMGSSDDATTILGVSIQGGDPTQNRGSGAMDLALRLNRNFRGTVLWANSAQRVTPAQQIDQTDPCDGGGSVRTFGTLSDFDGTGTLTFIFTGCVIDGDTLNGEATVRVDSATDFTMSFTRLTLRGPGVSVDTGGSLRAQLDIGTNAETITANLVSLNNNTGETAKTENLVVVSVPNSPTSFTSNISGRVFDQTHGYVDIITTPDSLLTFGTLTQLFPDSGQILLTGLGNLRIRATALSATLVMLELDVDAVDGVDNIATLKWTDLSGPVGADLADTDDDLMHNSWETVNGLDLADPLDAALDGDVDTFDNLSEYSAGTDPGDINSHP